METNLGNKGIVWAALGGEMIGVSFTRVHIICTFA